MKTHCWLRRSAALLCLAATLPLNSGRAQTQPEVPGATPAAQPAPSPAVPGENSQAVVPEATPAAQVAPNPAEFPTADTGSDAIPAARPALNRPLDEPYVLQIVGGDLVHNGKKRDATLANVVDALRDIWPTANIALAPELSGLNVADLKLRSTPELWEALEALRVASGYKFEWRKGSPAGSGMIDPATGLPRPPAGESSLYILDEGETQGNPLQRARRMVEVFNMRGYLDHLPAQDAKDPRKALDEIQDTVLETLASLKGGTLSDSDRLDFHFHPGTLLLILIGPPDAIEVARKVVTALTGQPVSRKSVLSGAGPDANQSAPAAPSARRYGLRQPGPGQEALPKAPSAPAPPTPSNPPPAPANPAAPQP